MFAEAEKKSLIRLYCGHPLLTGDKALLSGLVGRGLIRWNERDRQFEIPRNGEAARVVRMEIYNL